MRNRERGIGRRLAGHLLAISAAVTIALVTGEIFARFSGAIDRINPFPRALYVGTDDPLLPYRLRPHAKASVFGFSFRVNRFGLRGLETGSYPPAGVQRILVLGDSVIFGIGLDLEDTFAVQLEKELRQRGRRVEVLNGAAPGYNTETELAFLRNVGLSLAPHALILGVSLNDYGDTPRLSPLGVLTQNKNIRRHEQIADARRSWLEAHSELYVLLRWFSMYLRAGHWWQEDLANPPSPGRLADPGGARVSRALGDGDFEPRSGSTSESTAVRPGDEDWHPLERRAIVIRKRAYADPSGPSWKRLRQSLRELRDLAAAEGLTLTVIIFPWQDQFAVPGPNLDPQHYWAALCPTLRLRCLDLWEAFSESAEPRSLFQGIQHPNARGLRVAAAATAEFLAP